MFPFLRHNKLSDTKLDYAADLNKRIPLMLPGYQKQFMSKKPVSFSDSKINKC